jgi:perosamine synthetase
MAVLAALESGALSGAESATLAELERDFAAYLGVRHCAALNSGTAALHCCLAAADLAPGDEVIVPALSFVATAMAVLQHGAHPVFCDVESETFNIDPRRIEERITARTRAILVVHLHGMPADMVALSRIADRHRLTIVEDCAQAPGATVQGAKVGTIGYCAAFSLQATKNLPGGDGGLFVTNDDDAFARARRLSQFGEDVPAPRHGGDRVYWSHGIGWNYRAHVLAAALARSQLRRLDGYNQTARRNAGVLTRRLNSSRGLVPPISPSGRSGVFHKYRVMIRSEAFDPAVSAAALRQAFMSALRAEGVGVALWQHWPLPAHPVFRPVQGHDGLGPWDPDEFPRTRDTLERSFIVGSERAPLMVQDERLMDAYAAALAKVADAFREPETIANIDVEPAVELPG